MPALNHPHPQRLTLQNGLTLSIRHEPRLKRCAAVLRVAAGSHDVPVAWPGLAHFLEHLVFLGTERFPVQDNLMAYVQRHGGQINAHTSERHTDFFFELAPDALPGGLERLCDMLAKPRMNLDEQLREREVLHAEFIAWARAPSTQREFNVLQLLNPAHPLRAFHAGNRYSLPVPRAGFQQALKAYYQQFYQSANMTLSLAGPQPADELLELAQRCTASLPRGESIAGVTVPALTGSAERVFEVLDEHRLSLVFACDGLPQGASTAADFLCHWINADKPGGLVAHLRQLQLIDSLKATPLYQFNGQTLLTVEFSSLNITAQAAQLRSLFHDWLGFFSAQQDWPTLRDEYHLLQLRRQQVAGALELARRECEQKEPELSEQGVIALKAMLKHMQPTLGSDTPHTWQLPPRNPFLKPPQAPVSAGLIRGQTSAHRGLRTFAQDRLRTRRDLSAMTFSTALPTHSGEAAIYLRWQLATHADEALGSALEKSLRGLQQEAFEAGVALCVDPQGGDVLLSMHGLHEPMPALLEQALGALAAAPDNRTLRPATTPLTPIRQLLKRLPEYARPETLQDTPQVQACWSSARWDGLAAGLPVAKQTRVLAALNKAPGVAHAQQPPSPVAAWQRRWLTERCQSSEQALLLFCPAPTGNIEDEAAWRLLAQLANSPFYQRLRGELQLGYAVFSGARQLNGRVGLLFGVQSPHASTAEIFAHIREFLAGLPTMIAQLDEASFAQARAALAQQFSLEALDLRQAAQMLWQAKQAGHPSDYLTSLGNAVTALQPATTLQAAQRINHCESGWLCLATEPEAESFYLGSS